MINIYDQLTLSRLPSIMWVGLIQSVGLKSKNFCFQGKKKFCLKMVT